MKMAVRYKVCPHCSAKIVPCGTVSSYAMGCKCASCKTAKTEYEKTRQMRVRREKKLKDAGGVLLPAGEPRK
jgi:hypothetical protein